MADPVVCVCAPVFNESETIEYFVSEVLGALGELPGPLSHRLVLVDDGSYDGTSDLLATLAREDARIRVVTLSRNFGHQAAVTAALAHSVGDAVVVMDSDMQDDPAAIASLVSYFLNGYDVVFARRIRRKEGPVLRAAYALHYRLAALISRPRLPQDAGDFCLLSRRAVDAVNEMPERLRYVRGLRAWAGFKQIGVPVERRLRHAGASKYSAARLIGLSFDGLFSFSVVPLRIVTGLGLLTLTGATAYALYAVWQRVFGGESPPGFTALMIVLTALCGAILLSLGIVGEYVGRIYEEVKRRPVYIVASDEGWKPDG